MLEKAVSWWEWLFVGNTLLGSFLPGEMCAFTFFLFWEMAKRVSVLRHHATSLLILVQITGKCSDDLEV
jgi:hypothetical protein